MKNRVISIAVLTAVLAANVPALAQDDPATVQARARFNEGVAAYDKGQFEAARLAFQQAYAIRKHPAVLLNLAQSSLKSNHPLDASKYFKQYLKEVPTATTQQKADAEKGLADARKQVGQIEVVAPSGTEITLDDNDRLGSTPFPEPIDVDPGPHALKSTAETVRVTAVAGQKVQAKFGASAVATPVVTPPPTVAQNTPPPASTVTPDNSTNVVVGADTTKPGLFSPPENTTPVFVGLGVAGVGLVGAIVFAIFKSDAQTKADSVADDIRTAAKTRGLSATGVCSSNQPAFTNACSTLKDNNDKVDTDATIANISIGVMAAGLVFSAAWYLLAPKRQSHGTGLTFQPYAGYGNGGAVLGGSF